MVFNALAASKSPGATWSPSSPLESDAVPPWPTGSVPLMHSWDFSGLPSAAAGESGLLDVVRDYGATPSFVNATDDDGARIQRAIDDACDRGGILEPLAPVLDSQTRVCPSTLDPKLNLRRPRNSELHG